MTAEKDQHGECVIRYREKPITGSTKLCGIFAGDASHVVTPEMYGEVFSRLDEDIIFVPYTVAPEHLGDAIRGIRALNMRGVTLTVPHKVAGMEFLDEIDPDAKNIGAVNLVANEDGRLKGYNLDVTGFMYPLRNTDLTGQKILVIGSGGAARACVYGLAKAGADLTILNRSPSDAEALADNLAPFCRYDPQWGQLTPERTEQEVRTAAIVVNTTNVGYGDLSEQSLLKPEWLRSDLIVYDVIASPRPTKLLRDAEACGARTISGAYMVAGQADAYVRKMTGREMPVEEIMEILLRVLSYKDHQHT